MKEREISLKIECNDKACAECRWLTLRTPEEYFFCGLFPGEPRLEHTGRRKSRLGFSGVNVSRLEECLKAEKEQDRLVTFAERFSCGR